MGKKGKQKAKEPTQGPADEDALLEAAIAENEVLRKKLASDEVEQVKAKVAQQGKTFTMQETLAKLDRIMIFSIFRMLPDGSKDLCPAPGDGAVTFYTDAADAKADIELLKAADAAAKVGLDGIPLGRAFALTQGLMSLQTPAKTRLQFSRAIVQAEGESGVPSAYRERMRGAGPFPMFYSEYIDVPGCTPIFFTREDLAEYWVGAGGAADALPQPTVTDLRYVISRTLQEPGQWEMLLYVPPKHSAELMKAVLARDQRDEGVKRGFTSGMSRLKDVAKAAAIADGEEPPPLTAVPVS